MKMNKKMNPSYGLVCVFVGGRVGPFGVDSSFEEWDQDRSARIKWDFSQRALGSGGRGQRKSGLGVFAR